MSAKVLLYAQPDANGQPHQRIAEAGCEVLTGDPAWLTASTSMESQIAERLQGCDALVGAIIRNTPISRTILQASDKLRLVGLYTIGADHVDTEAATDMGILVTHGPTESNWGGVAEGTMANMLALLKRVRERDAVMRAGGYREPAHMGTYLGARSDGHAGITVGIVGLGRVGTRLADLLRPWNVRVIASDPYVDESHFIEHGVRKVDLATLLAEADVVTLHVYLNRETHHLIGEAELKRMKASAYLLNAARGPVVDEAALIRALESNAIAGAALDVFEVEPLPADSPLRKMGDKVLLSPHSIASNVGSGLGPAIGWTGEAVIRALRGEVPDHVFNKEAIPAWQERFGGRSVL